MAVCDNAYKIISITHGGTSFAQPTGGSITEVIDWIENRPADIVAPNCVAIDKYDLTARAKCQGFMTPVVRGTSATLTYTLLEFDGGNATIAVATMLAGAAGFDFDSAPFTQTQDFKYQGSTMTPFTVTV